VLPPTTISEAWAHTYTNRARTLTLSRRRGDALRHLLRALRIRPSYFNAWRGLAKLVLT
jgi:hypothetical protein